MVKDTDMIFIRKKINRIVKDTFCYLTCVTIYSSPPRFTVKTRSILYVTRAVFTVCGTWGVTVTAVETSSTTSYIKPT